VKFVSSCILLALLGQPVLAQSEEFEPPPLRLFEVTPRETIRGTPVRGVDIRGEGDGASRHFFYLLKVTRGVLTLQLQARARSGATALKVRLENEDGYNLNQIEAKAGADTEVLEIDTCQVDTPTTLRIHVNVDPNCGPYGVTLTGPLER